MSIKAINDFKFIQISTDEVYGSIANGSFDEKSTYNPNSPYSASKASSDHLVNAYYRTYGLPVTLTNCSNNYGPWQFPEKLIPLTIFKSLRGENIPIYGDGKNVRDWIHVDDNAKAIFGDHGDIQIYNKGGSSIIANQANNVSENKSLHLYSFYSTTYSSGFSQRFRVGNSDQENNQTGELALELIKDGAVNAYYDGEKRFSTSGVGATIFGTTQTQQLNVSGVSTFSGLIDANGIIEGVAGQNKIPSLYNAFSDLPNAGTYHGLFAHVHEHGRGYFAHAGGWHELVNVETNGNVGTGTQRYLLGSLVSTSTTATSLNVVGVSTFGGALDINSNVDIDGDTNCIVS